MSIPNFNKVFDIEKSSINLMPSEMNTNRVNESSIVIKKRDND